MPKYTCIFRKIDNFVKVKVQLGNDTVVPFDSTTVTLLKKTLTLIESSMFLKNAFIFSHVITAATIQVPTSLFFYDLVLSGIETTLFLIMFLKMTMPFGGHP